MKQQKEVTEIFREYENACVYNDRISYLEEANKNERFYAGDQWRGIKTQNLPTPVFNIFKRIIDHVISYTIKDGFEVKFLPKLVYGNDKNYQLQKEKALVLDLMFNTQFDKNRLNLILEDALLDGALSGDMCAFLDWDNENNRVNLKLLDGSNVMFADVYESDVQIQPYIIICGRELTEVLKKEALENGIEERYVSNIRPDEDAIISGDRGSIKVDRQGYTTYVIKLYRKEDGLVYFQKACKNAMIKNETCTMLKNYPIAWQNWTKRKNSYHGEAYAKNLLPNQIFINKCFSMIMKNITDTAFPKVVYNKAKISSWSNTVGGAIGINGDIDNVAKYIECEKLDKNVIDFVTKVIEYTKDSMGASDVVLGDVKLDNASAIKRLQDSSSVTLDKVKSKAVSFILQIAAIFLELVCKKGRACQTALLVKENEVVEVPFCADVFDENEFIITCNYKISENNEEAKDE